MKPISQQGISASDLARNLAAPKVAKSDAEGEKAKTDPTQPVVRSVAAEIASQGAPVNAERIAMIKAAIAEGRYPVDPEKIAEQMIALDLDSGRD
ncbi:MAG: flagellar biosynthesis anti-sigma factor FlgM [Pseudomonadota bacterium]